tara:strand:+ start:2028 stop:2315 length:288 start_codon:yes stop_codon:yes gene_type:complete
MIAIDEELFGIYRERDHNPEIIDYPVKIKSYQYGDEWSEGILFLQTEIASELNLKSPENFLGKTRWVDSIFVTSEDKYSNDFNRKNIWEKILGLD